MRLSLCRRGAAVHQQQSQHFREEHSSSARRCWVFDCQLSSEEPQGEERWETHPWSLQCQNITRVTLRCWQQPIHELAASLPLALHSSWDAALRFRFQPAAMWFRLLCWLQILKEIWYEKKKKNIVSLKSAGYWRPREWMCWFSVLLWQGK